MKKVLKKKTGGEAAASPKVEGKNSPKLAPQAAAKNVKKLTKGQRKKSKALAAKKKTSGGDAASKIPDEQKEKLKQEAIALIQGSCGKELKMKPFVPNDWAVKFKPALGQYLKFVKSLNDIFTIHGDESEKCEIKLFGAVKSSPKVTKTSPKLGAKASPKIAPKADVVKKKNLDKKEQAAKSPLKVTKTSPKLDAKASPKIAPKADVVEKKNLDTKEQSAKSSPKLSPKVAPATAPDAKKKKRRSSTGSTGSKK